MMKDSGPQILFQIPIFLASEGSMILLSSLSIWFCRVDFDIGAVVKIFSGREGTTLD
jgi:hypothetical protein